MPESRQIVGITLALAGNLLVSIALNLTKHAHNINQASAAPKPYVHMPLWWLGFATTLLGEMGNFAAYGFTEASVIAPLGAVSVLSNCFIASLVLGEGLRFRDLFGCALCIAGGVLIVVASPPSDETMSIDVFMGHVQDRVFVTYVAVLIAVVAVLLGYQDVYGHRHVSYYVLLCSLLGSVTVLACKGVSTFLTLWLCCAEGNPMGSTVFYLLLLVLAVTAVLQIRYLNIAMENFGNTETVPVFYVMFTISTIFGSNMLYKDFEGDRPATVALFCVGCLLTFGGVKLLTTRRGHGGVEDVDGNGLLHEQQHAVDERDDPSELPLDKLYRPLGRAGFGYDGAAAAGGGGSVAVLGGSPPPRHRRMGSAGTLREGEGGLAPLSLAYTPLGASGDVLRRTFTGCRPGAPADAEAQGHGHASNYEPPLDPRRGTL